MIKVSNMISEMSKIQLQIRLQHDFYGLPALMENPTYDSNSVSKIHWKKTNVFHSMLKVWPICVNTVDKLWKIMFHNFVRFTKFFQSVE